MSGASAAPRLGNIAGPGPEATAQFLLRLRGKGVRDLAVLRALEAVPREIFVPHRYADLATRDVALPIGCGQTMPEPFALARILEALELKASHRVLEVGTGSGLMTALLGKLAREVLSIERFQSLATEARTRLQALEVVNAAIVWADGRVVPPKAGVFDRIVVEAVVVDVPESWRTALAPGGRLLMARPATADAPHQCLVSATPGAEMSWEQTIVMRTRLQPLLEGTSHGL